VDLDTGVEESWRPTVTPGSPTAPPSGDSSYVAPGAFMRRVVNPIIVRLGGPAIVVRGRRTGRSITTPVPPFELGGVRYLVAGGGETNWVRNLRAAGEGKLRRGRHVVAFRAIELTGDERDRVVLAYAARLGRRAATFFRALPSPSQHPVFRIETP